MRMLKKSMAVALALILVLGIVGSAQAASDGTYSASAQGFGGTVTVTLTIAGTQLTDVQIVGDEETAGVGSLAVEQMPGLMLEANSVDVDSISGATFTSTAVLAAAADALAASGAVLSGAGVAAPAAEAGETVVLETDVVVVGGGGAGLISTIQAAKLGANVVLLEKTSELGGNTKISGGNYAAVDPERQKATGIEEQDSVELHIQDVLTVGKYQSKPELVAALCSNALAGIEFLESVGVEFEPTVYLVVGSSVPRSHHNIQSSGGYMVEQLVNAVTEDDRVTVLLSTPGQSLIVEDGAVTGVRAKADDGTLYEIRGKKGVILATGGYYANRQMVMKYNSNIHTENASYGVLSATGDGLVMAEQVGAALFNMNLIQMMGVSSYAFPPAMKGGAANIIMVNQNGQRFCAEDAIHDYMVYEEIFEQPGDYFYSILDQRVVDESENAEAMEAEIAKGTWFKADTIEALAEMMGISADALAATVAAYNESATSGSDEFGRKAFGGAIENGPYYGSAKRYPMLRYSLGGLSINDKCEVLSVDGQPIPGLYAAGEVAGGIHGNYRMSSHAITMVTVFGRIAAQTIMEK